MRCCWWDRSAEGFIIMNIVTLEKGISTDYYQEIRFPHRNYAAYCFFGQGNATG